MTAANGAAIPRRIAVIAHGGRVGHRRAALVAACRRHLGERLVGVEFTDRAGEATSLAERAVREGADAVVAAGGDGTAHEVMQALRGGAVALGLVPAGSGNDLAFHLGVRGDEEGVLRRLATGRVEAADRLEVNGLVIATAALWGVAAGVGEDANRLRAKLPSWGTLPKPVKASVYQVAAVARLLRDVDDVITMTCVLDGVERRFRAWSAVLGDSRRIGGAFLAFPRATKRDGLANLLVAEKGPWAERMLTAALLRPGWHEARPGIHSLTARAGTIETDRPVSWVADGEDRPPAARFEFAVVPGGLPLFLPASRDA